jgi:hypothetical protein
VPVTGSTFAQTGYTFKKYSIYDEDNANNSVIKNANQSDINYIVLRYADILLMYAEAKTELNQIDESVYDAINAVRERESVNMPPIQYTNSSDKANYVAMSDQARMREVIRHERRIEFAGEGYYYMDIIRWKTAEIVMGRSISMIIARNLFGNLTRIVITCGRFLLMSYRKTPHWSLIIQIGNKFHIIIKPCLCKALLLLYSFRINYSSGSICMRMYSISGISLINLSFRR